MYKYKYKMLLLLTAGMLLYSCPAKKEGAIEGRVSPANAGAKITVVREGSAVTSMDADMQSGSFRIAVPPGKYDINVTASQSSFPMTFPGVVVESGKTTTMPTIEIALAVGNCALTGKIVPAGADTQVKIFYEGIERATVNADKEGKYEFEGLPPGNYTIHASTPGYANDSAELSLADNQKTSQDIRLLYVSAVNGVDWSTGKIGAVGVGMQPKNAPNPTIGREMAKRAALADGRRNLLKTISEIRVNSEQNVKAFMGEKAYTQKVQGFIQGSRIVEEREVNGRVELVLELPLTGPNGLSALLSKH